MIKNLVFLLFISIMALVHAKGPVKEETISEAESYKLDSGKKERPAERAFAGAKAKKDSPENGENKEEIRTDEDSDVRFWRYSE